MTKKTNILKQIENAGLVGRGGASYPTAKKWAAVKTALAGKKSGYIIVNGAEGEPGVKKDGYLIKHYPETVLNGVYLADQFLGANKIKKVYFFLNKEYFRDYAPGLKKVLAIKKYLALGRKLEFIIKSEVLSYISGEESALLNLIEGKKVKPRLKPPFPTTHGLHGQPTLINNTETFYDVSLASQEKYRGQRFYTLSGAIKRPGVYSLPAQLSIEEVLRQTNNYPLNKFFVQVGGDASGEVLNSNQLAAPVEGAGSVMVYDEAKTSRHKLLQYWLKFYYEQSCGNCTICREGSYRLWEIINAKKFDKKLFWDLLEGLEETSFCALGRSLPVPIKSYFNNIKN
ncbi:MAG: NADH-ubiquinone oxidoreductase-F iron-sulfur binding region domain-containing protein [Patescibacteria group bacterium]|jgi:NADH:ubiquinone oxidoreductase subunit F (NADH-binding)